MMNAYYRCPREPRTLDHSAASGAEPRSTALKTTQAHYWGCQWSMDLAGRTCGTYAAPAANVLCTRLDVRLEKPIASPFHFRETIARRVQERVEFVAVSGVQACTIDIGNESLVVFTGPRAPITFKKTVAGHDV